jgi:hypothetical protein
MTQKEFEDRIGRKVQVEEYAKADSVYLASNMEKDEFCERFKKSDKKLVFDITDKYYACEKALDSQRKQLETLASTLLDVAYDNKNITLRNSVRKVFGQEAFVRFCLEHGYELDRQDREFVLDHLTL